MTNYDDDINVSGNDLPDIVTMAMARRTLRGLVPDAPPEPSEQLAVVLRDGLVATPHGFGWRRLTGRLASLGLAAKLMLAAGVAVASAGGAATAVAFSHQDSHHGDHPDSPRNHPAIVVPTTATGSQPDDRPEHSGHPGVSTTVTDRHGGTGGQDATSGHDGTSGKDSGSGSEDSTSGSHDGGSGSGSGDSTSGSPDGSGTGSTSDGEQSGSTSTSGGSTDTSGGSSGGDSGSDGGSSGGTSDGGSSGGTSDGGISGH